MQTPKYLGYSKPFGLDDIEWLNAKIAEAFMPLPKYLGYTNIILEDYTQVYSEYGQLLLDIENREKEWRAAKAGQEAHLKYAHKYEKKDN